MSAAITFEGVTKRIKDQEIISNVICSFEEQTLYGLLGRNGAGKTTLMKLMTGQIAPTNGAVRILGKNPFDNKEVQNQLCFIKESGNFKKTLRIKDLVHIAPSFYPHWDQDFAEALLDQFDLLPKKKVMDLSKGMESALGITFGLASRAPITIFDEPYIGMDAAARQQFYDLLVEDYGDHPRTIILSTHLIDEIRHVFERIMVMKKGEILFEEDVETLRTHAYKLSGNSKSFPSLEGVTILDDQEFMGTRTVSVLDLDRRLQELSPVIEKQPLPLQDFMIQITK
ncbi:ATP-binding cassette domain-containing protein [Halalkalibacterium ligniniphilum]|uniref:ATP-binding cassette domain-containing protein n=1 Tax=Halalkalibacterium ligniniphilum TaxID=1134413 RepID=UPI000346CDB4|nr:ABC transporter ATP-binding protein [Halalkalibacterium ligniniphilum]